MATATDPEEFSSPPSVSSHETVDAILEQGGRPALPLRTEFCQRADNGRKVPGPLAKFVENGDRRGLLLYLLLVSKASTDPWDVSLPAAVWARALGIPLPDTKSAKSSISKAWLRLERYGLVERHHRKRLAVVTLLREDGLRDPYTHPGEAKDRHLKLVNEFWQQGTSDAANNHWYEILSLPELAVLLIALTLGDQFRLPFEDAPAWYGISADTASRGIHGLRKHGLLTIDKLYKAAPLSAVGYTAEHRYTLQPPFGPRGVRSGSKPAVQPSPTTLTRRRRGLGRPA